MNLINVKIKAVKKICNCMVIRLKYVTISIPADVKKLLEKAKGKTEWQLSPKSLP
jgi:hypothetical protein